MIVEFQPQTIIDWNGNLAGVVCVAGCNYRCPFCYSADWVLPRRRSAVPVDDGLRAIWAPAVVISGGEPTLHAGIVDLLGEIRRNGTKIKLETNGSDPVRLKTLLDAGLLDYVAMDIKAPLTAADYGRLTETTVDIAALRASVDVVRQAGVEYEFCTTVIPGLLVRRDIMAIGQQLAGAARYVLRQFNPRRTLSPAMRYLAPYPLEQLRAWAEAGRDYIAAVSVRDSEAQPPRSECG